MYTLQASDCRNRHEAAFPNVTSARFACISVIFVGESGWRCFLESQRKIKFALSASVRTDNSDGTIQAGFPFAMDKEKKQTAIALIKAVVLLQLKVLLGAARDLLVGPTALVAAFVDLALLQLQEPRFFRSVLRFGEHSDAWIDVWSAGRHPEAPPRENVEALLDRVEEVVRDPQTGARKARVLKRWAERQLARAKQRAATQLSARLSAPPERVAPPRDPE